MYKIVNFCDILQNSFEYYLIHIIIHFYFLINLFFLKCSQYYQYDYI